jgi:tRNA threonylcarbamoyladenosine biosynthesis protein TsaE
MQSGHPGILTSQFLHWPDEDGCAASARALATSAALRDAFIALHGPLGAGKTSFVRHLLRALGVQGRIKSPTFAVLEPHEVPGADGFAISHFDFYRFDDPREWLDAGFRDVFAAPGLKLAEWPERAAAVLPPPDLALHIDVNADHSRRVDLRAHSTIGVVLMQALAAA